MFEVNESTGGRCGTNGTMVDVSVCTQVLLSLEVEVEECCVLRVACCVLHYPRTQEVLCTIT